MAAEIAITLMLLLAIVSFIALCWILGILVTELLMFALDWMVSPISWRSSLRKARSRLISRFSIAVGEVRRSW